MNEPNATMTYRGRRPPTGGPTGHPISPPLRVGVAGPGRAGLGRAEGERETDEQTERRGRQAPPDQTRFPRNGDGRRLTFSGRSTNRSHIPDRSTRSRPTQVPAGVVRLAQHELQSLRSERVGRTVGQPVRARRGAVAMRGRGGGAGGRAGRDRRAHERQRLDADADHGTRFGRTRASFPRPARSMRRQPVKQGRSRSSTVP
jgi:hypothetical protein